MRFLPLVMILALASAPLSGQFEQKLSLNLSGGIFNTAGAAGYQPDYATDVEEPTLMPNFKPGLSLRGGLQYNLNRHFSIEASLGVMISSGWYYDYSDPSSEPNNYLYYEILSDTVNYIVELEGENELFLTAIYISLAPRYYLMPGKKLNPYLYAGFNITFLDVFFQDNEYDAYEERGRLEEYLPNPTALWYDYSINAGLQAGGGAEFGVSDNLGIFLQVGYHFVLLTEESFHESRKYADFHSIGVQLGMRFSFLKSKEL